MESHAKVLGNNRQTLLMDAYKHINDKKLICTLRNGLSSDDLVAKDNDLNSFFNCATKKSNAKIVWKRKNL